VFDLLQLGDYETVISALAADFEERAFKLCPSRFTYPPLVGYAVRHIPDTPGKSYDIYDFDIAVEAMKIVGILLGNQHCI